jgi:hypothetical protein
MPDQDVAQRVLRCLRECTGYRGKFIPGDDTKPGYWGKLSFERISGLGENCKQIWQREFGTTELTDLDLSGSDLSNLIFAGANFVRCSFAGARLDGTRWFVHLIDCDFTGASLRGSAFIMANTPGTRFSSADLSGAHITYMFADGSREVDFSDAKMPGASIRMIGDVPLILSGADLTGARIEASDEWRGRMRTQMASDQLHALVAPAQAKRCFIATAACGDELAEEVILLRALRDEILLRSGSGRQLVRTYERFSPPFADWIAVSALRRNAARRFLVRPVARMCKLLRRRS